MPELPEVETIRVQLEKEVVGYEIADLWTDSPKQIKPTPERFLQELKGGKIKRIERRAKLLIFEVLIGSLKQYFVVHLKLTGRLLLRDSSEPSDEFVHIKLRIKNEKLRIEKELRFADARKFGFFQLVLNQKELDDLLLGFGPEPLDDLTLSRFTQILKKTPRKIKEVLMDQKTIAGIGNIYANDALWLAKIHPERKALLLSTKESNDLFCAIEKVLQEGLKTGGASDQWYRQIHGEEGKYQEHFKVYGRVGEACLRHSGQEILYKKVGQRGTFYCPLCQKL